MNRQSTAKTSRRSKSSERSPQRTLFPSAALRRRKPLILPRLLREEAEKSNYRGKAQDRAYEIITKWADLEKDGYLTHKETAIDDTFLNEVFGQALGYRLSVNSPDEYNLTHQYTISGIGTADGALGFFGRGKADRPLAVIELKGPGTDLDYDISNNRTAVQQCWDYLNHLPDTPWGIVSNFTEFRLYHRNKTPQSFEYFTLQDLRDIHRFRQFWCLFEIGGLVRGVLKQRPRALELLKQSEEQQRKIGDDLYDAYSHNRAMLIQHLRDEHGKSLEAAIHIAQKILDRIIFIAFCEDRGLLPDRVIEQTFKNIPPFHRVTNPRWLNFLELFRAIDRGHETLKLETGYNGGLFAHDPEVDDLQLDDSWTNFFNTVGTYDFRDEVNVEVLGHLFEKSIAEIERGRLTGLFHPNGETEENGLSPAMKKSAERKRFGIYYTPVEFTTFIVRNTVGEIIRQRLREVGHEHGIEIDQTLPSDTETTSKQFWRDCFDALQTITVCDPACGSGAFLIQAYDILEEHYRIVVDHLETHGDSAARELAEQIPDLILSRNLYGVDVSPQAVEIAQLALWIRSARTNKTLADLSENIICGNSLVDDPNVHPRAMKWEEAFPAIFSEETPGFDCVIGNPPWERMKLQEREFFAFTSPKIAGAVNAAQRRKLIAQMKEAKPELHERYDAAKSLAETTLRFVRKSDRYPLTGKGDLNTYALFAELARSIVAPTGRVGLLTPSGIASDHTTRDFFASLVESRSLISLYDFENKAPVFPDVHRSFKFCVLIFGGSAQKSVMTDYVFFAHTMEDLAEHDRHIPLSDKEIALLNPNTKTCPIFRSRRDAQITKKIYENVPILIDHNRADGGNPWGIRFFTMFHQTNDAELFVEAKELAQRGYKLEGNHWRKKTKTYLPLYEAKMVQMFDHRAAGVVITPGNWVRQGQPERTTLVSHQNPEFVPMPRWWVEQKAVNQPLGDGVRDAYLCYKDVTSPTNERTMIAAFIPHVGVVNSAPLVLYDESHGHRAACCLLANLNSFAYDYVARQKVGGVHLNFYIVEQLPTFGPTRYADPCPWDRSQTLESWISERVLKLTCTAND